MDNIFGIGLPEFVLILVIAGMVMGPERIARSARSLGVLTARLQNISRSFLRQLNAELDSVDETGQLKSTVEELDQLRRQVSELRNEVFTLAAGTHADGRKAVHALKREVENTILPPGKGVAQPAVPPRAAQNQENGNQISSSMDVDRFHESNSGVDEYGNQAISRAFNLPKRLNVTEDPEE